MRSWRKSTLVAGVMLLAALAVAFLVAACGEKETSRAIPASRRRSGCASVLRVVLRSRP